MAQDVINAEECSYVLEGSIFCFRMECPINIKFIWSDVSFTVYTVQMYNKASSGLWASDPLKIKKEYSLLRRSG